MLDRILQMSKLTWELQQQIRCTHAQSGPWKTNPSDYDVYTVSACVYQYIQYSILVVSFYTKPNPITVLKFYTKYYNIVEGLEKHFDTMAKYIGNDVFVSMTASRSSQSWEIAVRFIISLGLLLDPVLPSWWHISSVVCNSVLIRQSAVVPHQSSVQSSSSSASCTDLQQSTSLLKTHPILWQTNLIKHSFFAREQLVNKLVFRKLSKTNKKFMSKSIFTENNASRQSWCRERFTKDDNTVSLSATKFSWW